MAFLKGRSIAADVAAGSAAGLSVTPFTREDEKIESVLLKSAKTLFQNNPLINRKNIDAVLVSTNNNSKYLFNSIVTKF